MSDTPSLPSSREAGFDVFRGYLASTSFWLWVLVALGMLLRFRQFLFDRALFLDEGSFAGSFIDRDFWGLLFSPLERHQSAPPLYILSAKISVSVFGMQDWALRLPSFAASLAMLIFALGVAKRELAGATAKLLMVGLMATSPIFLYYSMEFKPYIVDACAACALLLAMSLRHGEHGPRRLAIVGFCGFLSSLPFVFFAAPAALVLVHESSKAGNIRRLSQVAIVWAAGFALALAFNFLAGADRQWLTEWWQSRGGFPPLNGSFIDIAVWYLRSFHGFVDLAFIHAISATPELPRLDDLRDLLLVVICVPLIAVGCLRPSPMFGICLAAILLCMASSLFRIYPFSSRLIIGFIPALFFCLAYGLDTLRNGWRKMVPVVLIGLLGISLPATVAATWQPNETSAVRAAMQILVPQLLPGDVVALGEQTASLYRFYGYSLPQKPETVIFAPPGNYTSEALDKFIADRKPKRLWILIGHRSTELNAALAGFQSVNTPSFFWQGPGTLLWLYENPLPSAS